MMTNSYRPPVDIIIGLDFGTSCTKVVLQTPSNTRFFVVDFGRLGHSRFPYLLPTRVFCNSLGELSLQQDGDARPIDHIKMALRRNDSPKFLFDKLHRGSVTPQETAACYLGLVLNYTRRWFESEHGREYATANWIWQCNLGIPSRDLDDKGTAEAFRRVVLAGWWLSNQDKITVLSARKALTMIDKREDMGIHPDYVKVVPEVIAEALGYAWSDRRQDGLHLLIDIGASTLDVCSFQLFKNEQDEDHYSILTSEVAHLGALYLHQHRVNALRDWLAERFERTLADPLLPIPDIVEYAANISQLKDQEIYTEFRRREDSFRDNCGKVIHRVIHELKRMNPHWDVMRTFLCGGGVNLPFYGDVLEEIETWVLKNMERPRTVQLQHLMQPTNLKARGLGQNEFGRMGVAYGLSFSYENLGGITPSHQVQPVDQE